jgi:hypothetical protein
MFGNQVFLEFGILLSEFQKFVVLDAHVVILVGLFRCKRQDVLNGPYVDIHRLPWLRHPCVFLGVESLVKYYSLCKLRGLELLVVDLALGLQVLDHFLYSILELA